MASSARVDYSRVYQVEKKLVSGESKKLFKKPREKQCYKMLVNVPRKRQIDLVCILKSKCTCVLVSRVSVTNMVPKSNLLDYAHTFNGSGIWTSHRRDCLSLLHHGLVLSSKTGLLEAGIISELSYDMWQRMQTLG